MSWYKLEKPEAENEAAQLADVLSCIVDSMHVLEASGKSSLLIHNKQCFLCLNRFCDKVRKIVYKEFDRKAKRRIRLIKEFGLGYPP